MSSVRPVYALGAFIPVAFVLKLAGASPVAVFATSALGVVPAAALMATATEHLAARTGPGVGGLVNVTFGNAPEQIIAAFPLADGLHEVVKASLVGSIVGNALLVLGAAMLTGGWRRTRQTFDRTAAQTQAGMLLLTVAALALPSLLLLARHISLPAVSELRRTFSQEIEQVSFAVAVVLIASYLAGLFFSLRTHRDLFNPVSVHGESARVWSVGRSVATLAAAKDKMDLAVNIAIGSGAQIGLFVAPALVLLSFAVGPAPMAMVFNVYEIAALLIAGVVCTALVSDGESTWFEGFQLIALYGVIGIIFFAA